MYLTTVRVVLEIRHGLLVEALADAGFTVLPVNPDLVARRRGPAKKKGDSEDARICALMALDAYLDLRRLIPPGETGTELRAIARDDEGAARDERRIGNRLRADPLAADPAPVDIADGDPGAPVFLKLLERRPSAVAGTSRDEVEALARSARHGRPGRFADQVAAAAARLAPRRRWPAPRKAQSGWPPPNCWPSAPSGAPGNGGWASSSLAGPPVPPTQTGKSPSAATPPATPGD